LDKEINGYFDLNGEIFYKPEKGAFYLHHFEIVDLVVNKANFSNKEKLKDVALNIVSNYLDNYPVYKLNPENFKQNIAKLLLKSVSVRDDNLAVLLSL
jgi:hypothetical protein